MFRRFWCIISHFGQNISDLHQKTLRFFLTGKKKVNVWQIKSRTKILPLFRVCRHGRSIFFEKYWKKVVRKKSKMCGQTLKYFFMEVFRLLRIEHCFKKYLMG